MFSANENYDGYELNIDDYAAICRYVGAEMEYTVGLAHCGPEEAAALAEYCNGDPDTKYGALRTSRGYAEPYNVKIWYVGSELGFRVPPEIAAEKNDLFTSAMLKTDPSIRTVCTTGIIDQWDESFLILAACVDICSVHKYLTDGRSEWDTELVLKRGPDIILERLRQAKIRFSGKPMLFDEWNMCWGCFGDSASALFAAGIMTMLIRHVEEFNLKGASCIPIMYVLLLTEKSLKEWLRMPEENCVLPRTNTV